MHKKIGDKIKPSDRRIEADLKEPKPLDAVEQAQVVKIDASGRKPGERASDYIRFGKEDAAPAGLIPDIGTEERQVVETEVERERSQDLRFKMQERGVESVVTETLNFRLAHASPYNLRATDTFILVSGRDPEATQSSVAQGYARISHKQERSIMASSCFYLALVHPSGVVGLTHMSTTYSPNEFLDEWAQDMDPGKTVVYLVKGNGKSDQESSAPAMADAKKALAEKGFTQYFEDSNQPVEGEPSDFKRGDNMSNITVYPDGHVEVERFIDGMNMRKGGIKYRLDRGKSEMLDPDFTMDKMKT